jgi:hypothetical protein
MTQSRNDDRIHFAGRTLGADLHVCGFFRSADEEYRVLLPFIQDGFERGDRAFHVVDPKKRDDHLSRLEAFGIKVSEHERSRAFELCDWNGAYLSDGRFDQDRMLAMWQATFDTAKRLGYARTRLVAHMEWALEDRPGVSDLIEYEARFNLLPRHANPVVCAYDLTKFRADVIVDVIRTHPMIIVGGLLQENPFYTPPDRFLRELRERAPMGASRL